MIALGKRPGLICKGAQPVDVYVGGHPVTPGITLEDYPLQEASGSVVTCEPITGYKLGVTSQITAVQEGEGDPSPDNVRPIRGWDSVTVTRCGRNLVNIPDYVETWAKVIRLSTMSIFETVKYKDNTQYTLSADITMSATDSWFGALIKYTDGTQEHARMAGRFDNNPFSTAPNKSVASITYTYDVNVEVTVKNTQLQEGATATPYEPYTGENLPATLPETVYGGTLDWRTGLLKIDHVFLALTGKELWRYYELETFKQHYIQPIDNKTGFDIYSDQYKTIAINDRMNEENDLSVYTGNGNICFRDDRFSTTDDWVAHLQNLAALGTPVQVCYEVNTAKEIQLTPTQIAALAGTNTIYSNSGDTTVTYRIRNI